MLEIKNNTITTISVQQYLLNTFNLWITIKATTTVKAMKKMTMQHFGPEKKSFTSK